jgi:capping protein alpha
VGDVSNGTHYFRLLSNVADIKTLAGNDASLLQSLEPAFRKYNEQQYATVKLPGSSEAVWIAGLEGLGEDADNSQIIVSEHNSLGDNRYFDSASQTSFQVEHSSQVRCARRILKAALPSH